MWLSIWGGGGVHWSRGGQGFEASGPTEMPALVLWWCAPCLLSAFLLCLWCVACKYGFICDFKGVLTVFLLFRVCLLGLGALRGLWGFYVRVWLGGFGACGVFACKSLLFFLSCPAFACSPAWLPVLPAFLLFVLFSWLCGLAFGVGWVVVSFSLSVYVQKERAQSVFASSLVLLWVVLYVLKHYRYLLRFIVPVSISFANDSCDRFGAFRWVVYDLPVVVNG